MRRLRDGTARSSYEVPDKRMEQRRCIKEPDSMSQPVDGRSPMKKAKPFCISKKEVWEAYQRVKANKGAAGTDGQTIEDFERKLKKNLYKIWNRMASGSYFPPPVRTVKIPKKSGGERSLGIPTVADRIAQQVVKAKLEPEVDAGFHVDSYGYRPGKSALDAVGQARQRCWRYDWVIDLDIKAFFDNLDQSFDGWSRSFTEADKVNIPTYERSLTHLCNGTDNLHFSEEHMALLQPFRAWL
jgi:RNA-directed DNA polymerase